MKIREFWRRAGVLLASLLVTVGAGGSLSAAAAPGYNYGKITVIDEPDTFSTQNVSYYIGEERADSAEIVWVDEGHTGKAIKLSGNGEFLRLGYTAARPKRFTFSGWINWQGAAGEQALSGQRLFTIARGENYYLTLSPYMRDESVTSGDGFLNGVRLRYEFGGTGGKVVDLFNPTSDAVSYALPCGEWHHIAVTVDGRALKMYIDGVLWFEEQLLSTMADLSGHTVDIGSGEWGDPTLNALLDDMTLYNAVLSESDIAELAGVGESAVYLPTAPSTTTTTTTTAPETTATTTARQTLGATVWGVPMWGVYTIIGVVAVYVLLAVVLNVLKRREQRGGEGGDRP